jgi:2-desacetyl-2-hydroxyethyl bacteriochlorophyllide A dehydrogenase
MTTRAGPVNGMQAVVCRKPGELALEERPLPERRDGEVLVAIRRIGICGTDYHIFEGLHPFLKYPRVMGHELAAEVIEAPAGSAYRQGSQVIVIPYLSCGTCIACRKGKTNCCTTLQCLGVHCDGGMCERISLPEKNLYPAEGLTLDQAAMVEFLAIGAHAVRRAAIEGPRLGRGPGQDRRDRALVVGAGPIGIGTALFARLAGTDVTLMERAPTTLKLASEITRATPILADEDAAEHLSSITNNEMFDIVFDATGNAKAMEGSVDYVASGGTYVLVGVVKDPLSFSDAELHRKEVTLMASRNATREDFDNVVAAMRGGKIPSAMIKTHSCGLEELPEAMPGWAHDRVGLVKAMVELPGTT